MRAPCIAKIGEELIQVVPTVLWVVVVLYALLRFREPIEALLGRLQSARLPGNVELKFGSALENAVKDAEEALELSASELGLNQGTVERLLQRARRNAEVVVGARVLWVDNNPHGNAAARKAMEELGISVTTALSTTEAELFLDPGRNDLVISNMKRPDEENPGDMLRDASIATA